MSESTGSAHPHGDLLDFYLANHELATPELIKALLVDISYQPDGVKVLLKLRGLQSGVGLAALKSLIYTLLKGQKKYSSLTDERLTEAYKKLAKAWKKLQERERKNLLKFLIVLTKISPVDQELLEQLFGSDVTFDGNTALFSAPRKIGGIVGVKIQYGLGRQFNYQGVMLPIDHGDYYGATSNLLETAEKQNDKLREPPTVTAKQAEVVSEKVFDSSPKLTIRK